MLEGWKIKENRNICSMNKHILNKLEKKFMRIIMIVSVVITRHKFLILYLHSKWV